MILETTIWHYNVNLLMVKISINVIIETHVLKLQAGLSNNLEFDNFG